MNITVIGTGFVGVVTAAVFAHLDNQVIALDVDQVKIDSLSQGKIPFFEPKLKELVQEGIDKNKLAFTTNYSEAISDADVIMISVGTPSAADGTADLKYLKTAASSLAPHLKTGAIVAIKSTVPPGTNQIIDEIIKQSATTSFSLVSLPEFLKEGTAVDDTLHPDRVVIGAKEPDVIEKLKTLHIPLGGQQIIVSPESAQMAKYSSNAYLAQRITFINQVANLCEKNGANINEVIAVMGADQRIGSHYWYPGLGYGGSCFPKDVRELAAYSQSINEGDGLFVKLNELNDRRIPKLMNKFEAQVGEFENKSVAVLGLSFKPNTDDMREAPALTVIPILQQKGATVKAYDPKAGDMAKNLLENCEITDSLEAALADVDIAMLLIEWQEFISKTPDYFKSHMKGKYIIDTRNQFDKNAFEQAGFIYIGIGQ